MKATRFPTGAALWAILALALALRIAGCLWLESRLGEDQRFEFGDSEAYWVLGQHIAHGEPYEYGSPHARVFRMPGYPALLAPLFIVFGDDPPVLYARLLSALLGTLAVAAVYWLSMTLFNRQTGLIAALAASCYPGAIATSALVLSEAPFCPLYLAQLAAWIKSWHTDQSRHSLVWAAASGLFGGLATLMRPDWLLFTPFAAVVAVLLITVPSIQNPKSKIQNLKRHVATVSVMLLIIAVTLTPWWWRNLQEGYHFVPTTLQVGASLYDGLSPRATGASDMSFVPEFIERENRRGFTKRPFEERLDERMFKAALRWAVEHPGRVAQLAAIKFSRMWNIWPNDSQFGSTLVKLITAVTFVPAIVAALAGIWTTRRQLWPAALCWLAAVYLTLLHMIFVSSIRYREPPMLALLVLAAAFVTRGTRPSPAP